MLNHKNECVKIGQINIRSWYSNKDYTECFLAKEDMDVMFICETWERINNPLRARGYRFFSKSRPDGYGGVAILLKKNILIAEVDELNFDFLEFIALKTRNLEKNLLLVSVYAAPVKTSEERSMSKNDLNKLIDWANDKTDLIMCGDLNAHANLWGGRHNCATGAQLVNLIQDTNLVVLNDGGSTYMGSMRGEASAIDLTFTSIALASQDTWMIMILNERMIL